MTDWTQTALESAQVHFWRGIIRLEELALVHRTEIVQARYYGQLLLIGTVAYAMGRFVGRAILSGSP